MLPGSEKRKSVNSSKVNLLISLTFHSLIVVFVLFFAAREGLLGTTLKTITVDMTKEKQPEKPKEPVKPKEPPPEPPKLADIKPVEQPKMTTTAPPPAATTAAPAAVAPAIADAAAFQFEGGKLVDSSSDPVEIYKALLQNALQSRWDRPTDLDDKSPVAEVEVAVDSTGKIVESAWQKKSGQQSFDNSVSQAIARTRSISSAPPANFPSHVVVRFDVIATEPLAP